MQRRDFMTYAAVVTSTVLPSETTIAGKIGQAWQTASSMPVRSQELYATVHQGKLYVAGGIAAQLGVPYFTNRVFSYEPITDKWSDEPEVPENLHHAALVSTGSRLFLVGGFNGSYSNIWRMREIVYELSMGEWQRRVSLPKPQAEGVLTHNKGDIHLVGGQSPIGKANSKRSDHHEVNSHLVLYASAVAWEGAAPMPIACNSATGGWVDNNLIVTGGRSSNGNYDHTHIYDKNEDKWRSVAPLPLPQAGAASVEVENGIIVFGGEIFTPNQAVFENVWRYDITTDNWTALPPLPTPRHGLGAGKIGNRIYLVGGATKPSGHGTSKLNEVLVL